jgi:coronatine-insensitive protein 1
VQGYKASPIGLELLLMARIFYNIEFTPPSAESMLHMAVDGEPCVDSQKFFPTTPLLDKGWTALIR